MINTDKKSARIITIASGKGGVGKTNISLNLSMLLSSDSRKVCLMDADLGMANIDVLLGLSPEKTLVDFLDGRCPLKEIILDGPDSLKIIPAGSALGRLPGPLKRSKKQLGEIFNYIKDYDELVIDAAAGLSDRVVHLLEAANIPVLVIVPEPTSLTDAYSVLKTLYKRGHEGPVFILVNRVKSARHGEKVFEKFKEAVNKFLSIPLKPIGYVLTDVHVMEAVKKQAPLVILFPDSPAARCLKNIADALSASHNGQAGPGRLKDLLFLNDAAETEDHASGVKQSQSISADELETAGDIVNLLIKDGHVTPTQVDYAMRVQERLDTPRRLLSILEDLGYISEKQIRETLYGNRRKIRIGSLLVELGYISEKQLSMALNQQKQSNNGMRLGELLVENNYISEYELSQALSINLGFPYIEPQLDDLDFSLLERASSKYFLDNSFLPLGEEKGAIKIATSDPLHTSSIEAAKRLFGPDLTMFITMEKFINHALKAYDSLKNNRKGFEQDKNEIVSLVDHIINEALSLNVSDIHIEPLKNRIRIRFRKDGSLMHQSDLPKEIGPAVVGRIKVMASADIAERRRHQDGRILMGTENSEDGIDIRVSFYVTIFGEKVVMRILNKKAEFYKIEDLGMGRKMLDRFRYEVLDVPSGVVIITGPTGSGKTTTLYASINYCNSPDTNIITAEEPVEYIIEGISQCPINPKIGVTFEETLRHMMRQDPDIIILGEIRDKFSAESAIQAALTGHKVLTTFHTEDSIGGLLRLMNMDIEAFLISSTVVSVVAQRLLKRVCPYCRKAYVPDAKDLRRLKYQSLNINKYNFQTGNGCAQCNFTGYRGRTGVFEMLILNEYVKEAILSRKTSYEIRKISIETTGLTTLLEDGLIKAAKGITSVPEVIKHLPILEAPRPLGQIYRLIGED